MTTSTRLEKSYMERHSGPEGHACRHSLLFGTYLQQSRKSRAWSVWAGMLGGRSLAHAEVHHGGGDDGKGRRIPARPRCVQGILAEGMQQVSPRMLARLHAPPAFGHCAVSIVVTCASVTKDMSRMQTLRRYPPSMPVFHRASRVIRDCGLK